jgi:excinuclease ABC subunit A
MIRVHGARQHNLKNISLEIPKNKLVVITGVSGSGKSSLAFDTLYAEGQRRYVESLSAYARQFLERLEKPLVDGIEGLSPAIAIEQQRSAPNARSTVATTTEIYDYLRVLYAAIGQPHDPETGEAVFRKTVPQIAGELAGLKEGTKMILLAPVPPAEKGDPEALLGRLRKQGFIRVRIDGTIRELEELEGAAQPTSLTFIEVVIDRLIVRPDVADRLIDSLRTALRLSGHEIWVLLDDGAGGWKEEKFTTAYMNPKTGFRLPELTPKHFSFNSTLGACVACQGLGSTLHPDPDLIVPDRNVSLAEGALKSWWAKNPKLRAVYDRQIDGVVAHFAVDRTVPFDHTPAAFQHALFHGTGDEAIKTGWKTGGALKTGAKPFEGLLAQAARLYADSESEFVRKHLTRFMNATPCAACGGRRLRPEVLAVKLGRGTDAQPIDGFCHLPISDALPWIEALDLDDTQQLIAVEPLKELRARLGFLADVGLGYLTLDREMGSLSGGEAQRIRLATQIGSGLSGVLYVLDEPSIGLHQRDNTKLIETLHRLRDLGNTVIVVEHDEETMLAADWIIDIGPGAGPLGGEILAQGTPAQIMADPRSLTGRFLSGQQRVGQGRKPSDRPSMGILSILGATENNLRDVSVDLPLGRFTAITGVSGSGKSTLINDILSRALSRHFFNAKTAPGKHRAIIGMDLVDKVVVVDQDPIGRSPRSNPITFIGAFTAIREMFAQLPAAKVRGFNAGSFSFNIAGGRCEACEGDGHLKIDMHFLTDVYVICESCQGKRYQRDVIDILFKGKSISDVLEMTFDEGLTFFRSVPQIAEKLRAVCATGLGYLKMGQSATTLSGGEAQRIKLAAELAKRSTGKTLYLLDEPTTGLHFQDIEVLIGVLFKLREAGNTVVVIEHNLDVIRCADHMIDLGPGGGKNGGSVVFNGTPTEAMQCPESETGIYLKFAEDRHSSCQR